MRKNRRAKEVRKERGKSQKSETIEEKMEAERTVERDSGRRVLERVVLCDRLSGGRPIVGRKSVNVCVFVERLEIDKNAPGCVSRVQVPRRDDVTPALEHLNVLRGVAPVRRSEELRFDPENLLQRSFDKVELFVELGRGEFGDVGVCRGVRR